VMTTGITSANSITLWPLESASLRRRLCSVLIRGCFRFSWWTRR
jgi:hypothetical protein